MVEKKEISNLTIHDFDDNQIWTWDEDDNSGIMPLENQGKLPDDYNALFIRSQFTLNDKTKIVGVINVRMSDHQVYLIAFPIQQHGNLLNLPLQPIFHDELQLQKTKLSNILQKPVQDIFPLVFDTIFTFSDGSPLKGRITA